MIRREVEFGGRRGKMSVFCRLIVVIKQRGRAHVLAGAGAVPFPARMTGV